MNKEVKEKWLAALRSGSYKQGRGVLREQCQDGDKFCCLGVLCDIVAPEGWVLHGPNTIASYHNRNGTLSTTFLDRVQLSTREASMLISLNDAGDSFTTIAEAIKEKL